MTHLADQTRDQMEDITKTATPVTLAVKKKRAAACPVT